MAGEIVLLLSLLLFHCSCVSGPPEQGPSPLRLMRLFRILGDDLA